MAKKSNRDLLFEKIDGQSEGFGNYFFNFRKLFEVDSPVLPAALAYEFHLIELAHHRLLYGALCRSHGADVDLAWDAVSNQHMTREKFLDLFSAVMGKPLRKEIRQYAMIAEEIRDRMIHGKEVRITELWTAIRSLTNYAIEMNEHCKDVAGFEPFGDMRGVVGKKGGQPLNKATTRWLLKGMGFSLA